MNSIAELAHQSPDPALSDQVRAQISALQLQLVERDIELKRRELKIQKLTLELAHHKRIRFGFTSEALTSEQRYLFIDTIIAELEQQQKSAVAPRQYKRPGRKRMLHLPRKQARFRGLHQYLVVPRKLHFRPW